MAYLNPREAIGISQRTLPHWRQSDTRYFVTFRLADSIPQKSLRTWITERDAFLQQHPPPFTETDAAEYHKRFTSRIETWLDSGMGSCLLTHRDYSEIVANALLYFESKRYSLGEWVIMPNHVHVTVTPKPGFELSSILHSWKSFTATRINQLTEKTGPLWQVESYNQILRNESHQWKVEEYIRNNPTKAGITVHHASFIKKVHRHPAC